MSYAYRPRECLDCKWKPPHGDTGETRRASALLLTPQNPLLFGKRARCKFRTQINRGEGGKYKWKKLLRGVIAL
jgi:hypothetical protein